MVQDNLITDLTILAKTENANLKKYFDSMKRNLPNNWHWIKDYKYNDDETFLLIENTIVLQTPYFKNEKLDEIYFGKIVIGLTHYSIVILEIKILDLINHEDLSKKYSKEDVIVPVSVFLNLFSEEILYPNKYYENFDHKYEFGAMYDENWFRNEIRDERTIKFRSKDTGKVYFFGKGKEAKCLNKKIVYFSPNNISISLNLMKKAYKCSQNLLKSLFSKQEGDLIKLVEEDKPELYEYLESITTSIIFGYIAVESFVNAAIPEDYLYEHINDRKIKEIYSKENIERWLSTSFKISNILPKVLGTKDIQLEKFWNDFKELEKIRNEIVHQKTIENGAKLDSKFYNKFFDKDIFKIISSSIAVIKFFYDYDNAHPYFPLGLGIAKFQFKEVDKIENEIGNFKEVQ